MLAEQYITNMKLCFKMEVLKNLEFNLKFFNGISWVIAGSKHGKNWNFIQSKIFLNER